ncbi:hypothetical protein [Rhizobium leguminosarum]
MSDSLLFGYSVEENDGKFVITLAGKLAVLIMQDIGANIEPEASGTACLPMMFPYSLLASHAVRMSSQAAVEGGQKSESTLSDIFAQGFDKDLEEFDRQLERYQALLSPAGSNGRGHETPVAVNEAADVAKTKTVVSKN